MAFQTFTLSRSTSGDADLQESGAITIGAGKNLRVRFSAFPGWLFGKIVPFLVVTRNEVESEHLITDGEGWVTEAVDEGDVVKLRLRFGGSFGTVAGIIEEIEV